MKKTTCKVTATIGAAILLATGIMGCGNVAGTADDLTGSVTMAGSTSMVTVNAEFTGSGAGIESLIAGSVDIGNSSRNLKDEEKSQGAVENVVAIDGIGVIVDPDNGLDGLTKEQLVDIYTGNISNWSELGGTDEPIVVVVPVQETVLRASWM